MKVRQNHKGKVYIELELAEAKGLLENIESSVGLPRGYASGNTLQRLGSNLVERGIDYLEKGQEVWGVLSHQAAVQHYNRKG